LSVVVADDKRCANVLDGPRWKRRAFIVRRTDGELSKRVGLSTILVLIFLFGPFSAPILFGLARDLWRFRVFDP